MQSTMYRNWNTKCTIAAAVRFTILSAKKQHLWWMEKKISHLLALFYCSSLPQPVYMVDLFGHNKWCVFVCVYAYIALTFIECNLRFNWLDVEYRAVLRYRLIESENHRNSRRQWTNMFALTETFIYFYDEPSSRLWKPQANTQIYTLNWSYENPQEQNVLCVVRKSNHANILPQVS